MIRAGAILMTLCVVAAAQARADEKPLWEFGMGVGTLAFPDYRGSDSMQSYVVPLPYFVYRGPLLKADRDGVRSTFLDNESIEINLSLNATTPVRGHSEGARHGMPNLKATVELGPSIDWHVWHSPDKKFKFDVRVPVRAPFTIESPPRSIGWILSPNLNLDIADPAGFEGWKLGLATGPVFASNKYHEYFYSVPARYATATRPEYRAPGGYGGTAFIVALSKRFPNYWVGGFVRYDTLASARFDSSPLVERQSAWFGGIGIAWMIRESKHMVETEE